MYFDLAHCPGGGDFPVEVALSGFRLKNRLKMIHVVLNPPLSVYGLLRDDLKQ